MNSLSLTKENAYLRSLI